MASEFTDRTRYRRGVWPSTRICRAGRAAPGTSTTPSSAPSCTGRPGHGRPPCTTCSHFSRRRASTASPPCTASTTKGVRCSRSSTERRSIPACASRTDEMIADAATWLRRYHDVVRDWRPGDESGGRRVTTSRPARSSATTIPAPTTGSSATAGSPASSTGIRPGRAGRSTTSRSCAGRRRRCATPSPAVDVARRVRIAAQSYGGVEADVVLDAVAPRLMQFGRPHRRGHRAR